MLHYSWRTQERLPTMARIMPTKTLVILLLALIVVFGVGCANIEEALNLRKPSASLEGLTFDEVGADAATLLFEVDIENPYAAPLGLLNIDYNLTSLDKPLLAGEADLQRTVPARGKETVTLPARVSYGDLVKAFREVRPGTIIPYRADMGLSVDAGDLGTLRLPITKESELTVPAIPNLSDVDWKKLLLDKAIK